MTSSTPSLSDHDDTGCAYPLDEGEKRQNCGSLRQPGSPYCPTHHALCHVASGTNEEVRRLLEVELLAGAVGGRRARGGQPSRRFLHRLEQTVRHFSSLDVAGR